MFVGSAICGNFVGVEWYAMHLFAILIGRSELTNIFKAILLNLSKLAILSMLAGVFILVFNVISLNQYTPVIYNEDTSQTDTCYEMLGCVLELYTSQAIGDDMDKFQLFRFFFDTLYVVFMEMLFQNIVGGIIIDAFAGLKEEDEAREEDQKNLCYICSLSKPDVQFPNLDGKVRDDLHETHITTLPLELPVLRVLPREEEHNRLHRTRV